MDPLRARRPLIGLRMGESLEIQGRLQMIPFEPQQLFHSIYRAIRRLPPCVLVDCSDREELHLAGPDADDFLHRVSTAVLRGLPIGAGRRMLFLDGKGHVRGAATGWRRLDGWVLDTDPSQGRLLLEHLQFFHVRERLDITLQPALGRKCFLFGAGSSEVLEKVLGVSVSAWTSEGPHRSQGPGLRELGVALAASPQQSHDPSLSGAVLNTPGVGRPSVWLRDLGNRPVPLFMLVMEGQEAEHLVAELHEAGAVFGESVTREFLRVLAGWWVFGVDVTAQRLGPEVTEDESLLSLDKGCYPGQEVVARIASRGHVNWRLRGVSLPLECGLTAGDEILSEGQKIGWLTSVVEVPAEDFRIGLAYMKKGFEGLHQIVLTDSGPIMVHPLPFDLGRAG